MKTMGLAVFLLICPVFGQVKQKNQQSAPTLSPASKDDKGWKFNRYSGKNDESYPFRIPDDWEYIDCRKRSKKQVKLTIVLTSANERSCFIPKVSR